MENEILNGLIEKYPTYYTKFTNFDAHLLGDELFLYTLNNGYSVLREKAPVDFSLIETIKTIPSQYDTVINLVVTGNLASLIATRERYEEDILKSKNARLSNIEAHNKCYDLLPEFILQCLKTGVRVNYIVPRNNEFETMNVTDDALNLLERLRKQSNEQAILSYEARMNNIKNAMKGRNAPQEQYDELAKIESIYLGIIQNIKSYEDNQIKDLQSER